MFYVGVIAGFVGLFLFDYLEENKIPPIARILFVALFYLIVKISAEWILGQL